MNGRPWRICPDELEPLIRERRERGDRHKTIAAELGYCADRIKKLCSKWQIYKKGLKPKTVIDRAQVNSNAAGDGIRASAVNAKTSAASEATPSDTRQAGSHP